MKNFNRHILEAVNRGIQIALDDYEDIEPNSSLSHYNDVINNDDVIRHKIDLMKEVVDLGLPSGTLWCKYNLGVNTNQLIKPEDWYGNYYAWGELEPIKNKCGWSNYKFGIRLNKLTKYCNNPENGLNSFADNLTQLLPEDDVAYQNKKLHKHNFKFYIPTKEQCEELINYTNNYWVYNYNPYWVYNYNQPNKTIHNQKGDGGIQGLNGRVFIGKNGNQLFIPAAGCYYNSNILDVGSECYLWSSNLYLNYPNNAYFLDVDLNSIDIYDSERCDGFSIRPVINL